MTTADIERSRLHRLYGPASRRIAYRKSDLADYVIMMVLASAIVLFAYASQPVLAVLGLVCCLFLIATFPFRHGLSWRVPIVLRSPLDAVFALTYRVQNITWVFVVAVAVLAADNLFIALTPELPHQSDLMREIALGLFFAHFGLIALYRSVILGAHLRKREHVREFLMQTTWKKVLLDQPSVTLHLVHAWVTGILTHLVLIAPWFILINHLSYSVISVAVVSVINVVVHYYHMRGYPRWFYREHWVGHATEFDFVYMHGTHHDAIPSGMIGVSGNGVLEGFARDVVGNPLGLYSPFIAFLLHSAEVIQDMRMHQFIPGIHPLLPRWFHEVSQHSTHHFGRLEPFGIGLRLRGGRKTASGRTINFPPVEILNSIEIDEELNEFKWDNPRYQRFLALYDKYQPSTRPPQAEEEAGAR